MSRRDKLPRYYLATDYAGENPRMEESDEFGEFVKVSDLREAVEAMDRRTVPERKADGWEMACAEILDLLDELTPAP